MSPLRGGCTSRTSSFPRVSGDEPGVLVKYRGEAEFSPRERG